MNPLRLLLLLALLVLGANPCAAYDVGAAVNPWQAQDESGRGHSLGAYKGKVVVLVWWAPNDPSSKGYADRLEQLKRQFAGQNVVFLAVASVQGIDAARAQAGRTSQKLTWPVLLDPTLSLANAFQTRVTTQVQVIDAQGKLRYKGQIDDDPRAQKPAAQRQSYLQQAVQALLSGGTPPAATSPPRASRIH